MLLPSQVQLSNTFGEWVNATNEIITAVGNTSKYILVSQNATPDVTTGNISINGVMTLTSLKANGGLGSSGQFLTSNGNNVYWSTLVDANSSASGLVNTATQTFAGNKTFDNNVAIIGYLTVGNSTITLNSTTLILGNTSSNLVMNSSSVTLDGSQVINSSGTANNASNLNGQSASYYTNASNLSAGTLAIDRLDANVLLTSSTTGINASALSTGTVPLARLSSASTTANGVMDTTTQSFAGNKTFQNAASFSNTVSITGAVNALSTLGVTGAVNALGLLGVSGNATFAQDVVVTGNLTVSGSTTYINTTNLQIGDNIIALNADLPPANAPTENAGIEINRGSSANTYLRWNEVGDVWEVTNDGTNYGTLIDTRSTTGINASALSTGTVPDARITGAYTGVTSLALGANVVANLTTVFVGNSTANVSHIATQLSVANSTNTATLTPISLTLGTQVTNTVGFYAGANVYANTTTVFLGNSTANTVITSASFAVANSTNTATITPISLTVGTQIANSTGFYSGANVYANTTTLFVGNSTSNTVITSGVVNTGNVSIVGVTALQEVLEKITISATAATGTIAFDGLTQGVLYYTTNASANWTLNFRGNSTVSLNTVMSTGQSFTVAFLVSQGATAYYASAHQVDGSSVTPKWQNGTAPTSGNINSVDIYSYTVVKTGSAAFTVFASQTKFA